MTSRSWRVPLRYQLTTMECGAACLAMVASHHGRQTLVSEARELLGPGRDGLSVRRLAESAPEYGLLAEVDRGSDVLARPLEGPAIAYLHKHHFVVLERVGRRGVRVVDPGGGRQWMTRAEFDELFAGTLIRLRKAPGFTPRRIPIRHNQVTRYLREFVAVPGGRRLLAMVAVAAALLAALGLVFPLITKYAIDFVLPDERVDLLPMLAVAVAGTAVLHGMRTLLRSRLLLGLRARADVLLTERFVNHLLALPLLFYLQRSRGDLLMRLNSVSSTRETLTQHVLTMVLDAAMLSGYLVGLALFAPEYLLVVAILGGAQVAVLVLSYRRVRVLARRELITKAEEQSYLVETLEAVGPIKANGMERRVASRWRVLFLAYRDAMLRRGKAMAWVESAQSALSTLAPLALLWSGLWLVLAERMTLGTMLAVNAMAMAVLSPMQKFVSTLQLFAVLRAQIERLYDVLDAPEEPTGPVRLDGAGPTVPVSVKARGLAFAYHAEAPPVLSGVDFDLPAGGKLGIVGRTGSGKSTLALLVLGLLRPQTGSVSHDGVPMDRLDVHDLRGRCGAVLQELTLFNGTIRANLTLGSPDAGDADVVRAATIAGLHEDVLALPMRYETIVGEGGTALSAGQRQRIALARALLHRPRLLVLDEATSHLDPQTERRVDEALSALAVTRLVISHRLSAIRNADQILVLDRGRIVSRGRHEELIEEGGMYRTLFGTPVNGSTAGPAPRNHGLPPVRLEALNP